MFFRTDPGSPPTDRDVSCRSLLAVLAVLAALILLALTWPPDPPPAEPPAALVVRVNEAPPKVLFALPGLGPTLVQRLLDARDDRPFDSLDDLASRVKGIGPATLETLRPFIVVDPPGPDPDSP